VLSFLAAVIGGYVTLSGAHTEAELVDTGVFLAVCVAEL
jgi:hypothetical protein